MLKKSIIKTLIVSVIIACIVKLFVVETYTVPTDSMEPTIQTGSKVMLLKLPFMVKKGDIIGFQQGDESFVKRVLGCPKDTVLSNNGHFELLQKPNKILFYAQNLTYYTIPRAGETMVFDASHFDFYRKLIEGEGVQAARILDKIFINNVESNSYTFKNNYYFVQGDNTERSIDSRSFGLISEKDVLGKILFLK